MTNPKVPEQQNPKVVLEFFRLYADYLRIYNFKWEEDGYYHISIPQTMWDYIISAPDVEELLNQVPELKKENQVSFYGMKIKPILTDFSSKNDTHNN